MSPAERQDRRVAAERLEALRFRLAKAPQGQGEAARSARRTALQLAQEWVAKWPGGPQGAKEFTGRQAAAHKQALDLLEAYRQGCLPRPEVVPEGAKPQPLTVGALRALLHGLADDLPLARLEADAATVAAIARTLAMVPPVRRFSPKASGPQAKALPQPQPGFQHLNSPEAMGF